METVSQLDQDDPDVLCHGKEHFAVVFRLFFFLGLVLQLVELGDTVHKTGHFLAEAGDQLFPRDRCILDDIMEKAC